MQCPLLFKVWDNPEDTRHFSPMTCLEKDCAWWDEILGQCSIKTLGTVLDGLLMRGKKILERKEVADENRKVD